MVKCRTGKGLLVFRRVSSTPGEQCISKSFLLSISKASDVNWMKNRKPGKESPDDKAKVEVTGYSLVA